MSDLPPPPTDPYRIVPWSTEKHLKEAAEMCTESDPFGLDDGSSLDAPTETLSPHAYWTFCLGAKAPYQTSWVALDTDDKVMGVITTQSASQAAIIPEEISKAEREAVMAQYGSRGIAYLDAWRAAVDRLVSEASNADTETVKQASNVTVFSINESQCEDGAVADCLAGKLARDVDWVVSAGGEGFWGRHGFSILPTTKAAGISEGSMSVPFTFAGQEEGSLYTASLMLRKTSSL